MHVQSPFFHLKVGPRYNLHDIITKVRQHDIQQVFQAMLERAPSHKLLLFQKLRPDACKAAKIQAQLWGYKGKVVQMYTNHTVSRVKLEMRKYTWVRLPCHFKLLVSFMWDVMILRYVLFFSGV